MARAAGCWLTLGLDRAPTSPVEDVLEEQASRAASLGGDLDDLAPASTSCSRST